MQVVMSGKPLGDIGLRLEAVYEHWMQITWPKSSIHSHVTSHPVSKSLRIVIQVVISGKPLNAIGLWLDAVYQHRMHIT